MDTISLITFICGVLGGILLLLCVILVSFFIYTMCRKHCFPGIGQYSVVPAAEGPGILVTTGDHFNKFGEFLIFFILLCYNEPLAVSAACVASFSAN